MPLTINFTDFESQEKFPKRRNYLINLWRSMLMTTDRVHVIPEAQLQQAFEELLQMCGESSRITIVFRKLHGTREYPWREGVNLSMKRGQFWTVGIMFAAMKMVGFSASQKIQKVRLEPVDQKKFAKLQNIEGEKLKSMEQERLAFMTHKRVEEIVQEEVVDEWLDVHEPLFEQAIALASGTAASVTMRF